ncbi:MAG: hypothetical protein PHG85_06095 [Candidatus Altiarchaeota archaeon]|nr:hypothetical protein [Candidatus Altiarchaeota archaeon]
MNASFHVLAEILEGFESGTEKALYEKYVRRYEQDAELKRAAEAYKNYLADQTAEKRNAARKILESLHNERKFESSGSGQISMSDRRNLDSKKFYQHEEQQ